MEDKKIIDQTKLAEDIAAKIDYEFTDLFLVKKLDPIKVKKEFSKPIPSKKQKNGDIIDYDKVETEVKEVDSDYAKGVVIKVPMTYKADTNRREDIQVGNVIVFKPGLAQTFDWLKDSVLISRFGIIAIQK